MVRAFGGCLRLDVKAAGTRASIVRYYRVHWDGATTATGVTRHTRHLAPHVTSLSHARQLLPSSLIPQVQSHLPGFIFDERKEGNHWSMGVLPHR